MAEIKSTIDLVMERTKNMVQSDEEKKRNQTKDMENKAKGHVLRLMEGQIEADELLEILDEIAPDKRGDFKIALLRTLTKALNLEADHQPILAGIRVLSSGNMGTLIGQIEDIMGEFIKEREEIARGTEEALLERLSAQGISGSAVRVKLESEPSYAQKLSDFRKDFRARLERTVDNILEQLG